MNSFEVLVYDDELRLAENWAEKIKGQIKDAYSDVVVKPADGKDFQQLLTLINSRRKEWRKEEDKSGTIDLHDADTADVIVVDYDLLQYSDSVDTTGSRLAYLLRCFSKCGFIIVLNEFGRNVFDLSLGSPPEGFADIHIGDEQIGNPGLWQAPFDGYRPWYWPVVPDARKNFELCVNDVEENLDTPILDFLGLGRVIDWIPRRALDFLLGKKKVEEVTFKGFVESAHGGISAKDTLIPEQKIARVAAARIVTLLNSIILPEQSVLVDAPHLVSRFPSLIPAQAQRNKIDMWNKLCNPVDHNIDNLLSKHLKEHRFQKLHWLWRPAWYWSEINKDENIEEVKDPGLVEEIDWVFCENISRFVPIEFAQDFRAIVSPPFIKRYVFSSDLKKANHYVSHNRSGNPQDPQDPSLVEYVPQAMFSL